MRVLAVCLAFVSGCASSSSAPRKDFTLRTGRGAQQMAIVKNGDIVGPTLQLSPTDSGYRGMADSAMVDLRSDGERIVGTIRDKVVDLHISLGDDGLVARGLFAGKLGRLDASNLEIRSTLGVCSYELEAVGTHYEGQRACGRTTAIPMVHPAAIELPPGFERLKVDRQVMLLAILLTL
jgi:hypothetical protein